MHRRRFPSILLYGFGLALALSLAFNGFLLYRQSHQPGLYDYTGAPPPDSVTDQVWATPTDSVADPPHDSLLNEVVPNVPPPAALTARASGPP